LHVALPAHTNAQLPPGQSHEQVPPSSQICAFAGMTPHSPCTMTPAP